MNQEKTPHPATFEWARLNDQTVNVMLQRNEHWTDIVAQLSKEKAEAQNRVIELEMIAPRKITLPDGAVAFWHCPNEFVPEVAWAEGDVAKFKRRHFRQ